MGENALVFISHTGRDGVKEELARPTSWFLTEILEIETFLDDGGMQWGQDKMQALARAAYQCTHALVLFSPSFRKQNTV